jgi:hypothetical protein
MDLSMRLVFFKFAIDISSVADLDNPNGQLIILNGIDDAVVTLADPETFLFNALTS